MYQIMSAQIIRQAMAWEGLPKAQVRLTGNFKWPSGKLSCTYRLEWPIVVVEAYVGEPMRYDGCRSFVNFMDILRGAFCEDVTITSMSCQYGQPSDAPNSILWAEIYCTVTPRDELRVNQR